MSAWGGNSNNESKPKFPWIVNGDGKMFGNSSTNNSANTYATEQGWVFRWPWGEEVLVGIGQLATNLGAPTITGVELVSAVSNIASANIRFRLEWNEPVTVSGGTPSIVAIGSNGAANIVLTYSATDSDANSGKLVFANTTQNLNTAAKADWAFTVNSTSGGANFTNYDAIKDRNNSSINISSTLVGSALLAIDAYKPGIAPGGIVSGAAPSPAANQTLSITVNFNEAVTVTGSPSVVAVSSNTSTIANKTLVYHAASSNTTAGNLVFRLTGIDMTGANSIVFTINGSSTLANWPNIVGISGNSAQNTLGASANTVTVAAS